MKNIELYNYIVSERARGIPDPTIRTALLEKGWKEEDVLEVLEPQAVRPLPTIGELLRQTRELSIEHFKVISLIALPVLIALVLKTIFDIKGIYSVLLIFLFNIISVTTLISFLGDQKNDSFQILYEKGVKAFPNYFFASLLSWLLVGFGSILFIVPGIYFGAMYGLAPIISVIENLGPIAAMNRSKFYSSNQIPSIAFLYIVGIIFFFIGDFVITIIFHFALGAFGKSLFDSCISYLTSMVSLIYTFILYNEVKKRA